MVNYYNYATARVNLIRITMYVYLQKSIFQKEPRRRFRMKTLKAHFTINDSGGNKTKIVYGPCISR